MPCENAFTLRAALFILGLLFATPTGMFLSIYFLDANINSAIAIGFMSEMIYAMLFS